MRHIVAATDLSSRALRAIRRAGRLAKEFSASLTLVHVVNDDPPAKVIAAEQRESMAVLEELKSSLPEFRDLSLRLDIGGGIVAVAYAAVYLRGPR